MSDEIPVTGIDVVEDPVARDTWTTLISLLDQSQIAREDNKSLIDQLILQLVSRWLGQRDECGVAQDLMDIALYNLAGGTLEELAGNSDVAGFLPPGNNETAAEYDDIPDDGLSTERSGSFTDHHDDDRRLQFFTEDTCSTFQSTVFLGSMLSFSSCANIDIGKFFGTVEENIVNVGLHCLNTLIQPFQRENTCASRNYQNFVMDQCVEAIIKDDIIGHIFQLFLVSPKQTCGCMSALAAVPSCRVDITSQVALDGKLTSQMACLLESQVCTRLEENCGERLGVLDECLPDLSDINDGEFDCDEVMCNCEKNDRGLVNYPGKAMELPLSDMCADQATGGTFDGLFVAERYALFQEKCGANFLHQNKPPTEAPTVSPAPSMMPTTEEDGNVNLIGQQNNESAVNSVMSGILLALAITGVASIFLVFVLILWRRRFRSHGKQVQTIAEMKANALEQIRQLEAEVQRLEEEEESNESILPDF